MNNNILIKYIKNENNETIFKSISLNRKKDSAQNALFKSIFYYKISEESEFFNDNSGFCTISWKHSKPINYKNFHEYIVPLDWALNLMGYNMLKDEHLWRDKLNNDKNFAIELTRIMNHLKPISKSEYFECFNLNNI